MQPVVKYAPIVHCVFIMRSKHDVTRLNVKLSEADGFNQCVPLQIAQVVCNAVYHWIVAQAQCATSVLCHMMCPCSGETVYTMMCAAVSSQTCVVIRCVCVVCVCVCVCAHVYSVRVCVCDQCVCLRAAGV